MFPDTNTNASKRIQSIDKEGPKVNTKSSTMDQSLCLTGGATESTLHKPLITAGRLKEHAASKSGLGYVQGASSYTSTTLMLNYRRKATVLMANRSNPHGVKDLVLNLDKKCNDVIQTKGSAQPSDVPVPLQECVMIAAIANDAYYRCVIGSVNGIEILIKTMQLFPNNIDLQASCCTALGNLCEQNASNQLSVQNGDGIQNILSTMRLHFESIVVIGAGCDALHNMSSMVVTLAQKNEQLRRELDDVLLMASNALDCPKTKEKTDQLLTTLQNQSPNERQDQLERSLDDQHSLMPK